MNKTDSFSAVEYTKRKKTSIMKGDFEIFRYAFIITIGLFQSTIKY